MVMNSFSRRVFVSGRFAEANKSLTGSRSNPELIAARFPLKP